MIKKHKFNFTYTIFLVFCSIIPVLAQIPVQRGPASQNEIKNARTKLDSNLNNFAAHRNYIYAMGINNPLLTAQYKVWMDKYPQNVNIPLAIGTVYYNAEMPQAKDYLQKAVAITPNNGKIWSMLSADAFTRGQKKLAIEYMKKATLADTLNAGYAASYLMFFEDSAPNYKQMVFDFTKRFPTSERGAQVLYWLAERNTNIYDRINYFENLRKLYPPRKFDWSASGMIGLTDAYLQTDPEKALAIIDEMGDDKNWLMRKQVAESLIQINKLEQDQNYTEALIKVNQIILPQFNYINDFIALKKASLQEKVGNSKIAYDTILAKFSKIPTDQLYTELNSIGKKINKNEEQVFKDIAKIRHNEAVPAYPFTLDLYTNKGKLSLESLKGKVVLLTFWFPACGPCRAEFPHFQAVIDKFKGRDVVYVGVNVFPEQDPYVIPLLKNTKYSFIPLRGSLEFAAKYYGVKGEPENFLIDKNGMIVFKNFNINNSNHRTLELMISSLLQKDQLND
jgi:thiol-disulfide isomerase/thioredoxin